MKRNAGEACNVCSLLLVTFFDFEALTEPFHCYTFLLAGPYCHLAGKWIFLWGLIQFPMASAKIFPFALIGTEVGLCFQPLVLLCMREKGVTMSAFFLGLLFIWIQNLET